MAGPTDDGLHDLGFTAVEASLERRANNWHCSCNFVVSPARHWGRRGAWLGGGLHCLSSSLR
eukprot:350621-Chlamydomonas_euryale.AAC.3